MTCYFPILPNIKIDTSDKQVYGSLTYINMINNRRLKNKVVKDNNLKIAIYKHNFDEWILVDIKNCLYGETIHLSRSDYSVKKNQMLLAVRLQEENILERTRILPKPFSSRVDDAPIAERASLNLKYLNSVTSYQGEYPYQMANLQKGSLLCIDGNMQQLVPEFFRFIIFMQINVDSRINEDVDISLFNPENPSEIEVFQSKRNIFTVINLNKISKLNLKKTLFATCNNCSFIPLIFSLDKRSNQLSLEHTTPPADMLWGKDRFNLVKKIKSNWIK